MAAAGPMAGAGPFGQPVGERAPLLFQGNAQHPEKLARQRRATGNMRQEAAVALVPFGMFVLTSTLWTFCAHRSQGSLTVLTLFVLFILLCFLASTCGYGYLSVLGRQIGSQIGDGPWSQPRCHVGCLIAVVVGAMTGYFNYDSGLRDYWSFFDHWQYSNVWPDEPAAAHRDAAAIVFAEGSRPDAASSSVFTAGHHSYCAAPVRMSGDVHNHHVQYWAVGVDCCTGGTQPTFTCDDASNSAARAGLVVYDRKHLYDWFIGNDMDFFQRAAKMAMAKYGIVSDEKPIFLRWSADIESSNRHVIAEAWLFLLKAAIFSLPVFVLLELGLSRAKAMTEIGYKKMKKAGPPTMQSGKRKPASGSTPPGVP